MFFRIFGVKCDRCGLVLSPHDLVMRTMSYIYHLGCFQCVMCGQSLQVNNDNKVSDKVTMLLQCVQSAVFAVARGATLVLSKVRPHYPANSRILT